MIILITGIFIGVAMCYLGTLASDIIKTRKFMQWLRNRGLDPYAMDNDSIRAARIAYIIKDVPNVEVEVCSKPDNDIE